jgi:hypothetical protein
LSQQRPVVTSVIPAKRKAGEEDNNDLPSVSNVNIQAFHELRVQDEDCPKTVCLFACVLGSSALPSTRVESQFQVSTHRSIILEKQYDPELCKVVVVTTSQTWTEEEKSEWTELEREEHAKWAATVSEPYKNMKFEVLDGQHRKRARGDLFKELWATWEAKALSEGSPPLRELVREDKFLLNCLRPSACTVYTALSSPLQVRLLFVTHFLLKLAVLKCFLFVT